MTDSELSNTAESYFPRDVGIVMSCFDHDCNQECDGKEGIDVLGKCLCEQNCETHGNGTCATHLCENERIVREEFRALSDEQDVMEKECTICMESFTEVTVLPCHCKLHYCRSCWDTALANSFSQCGQARCPSCRSPVRVDFDTETNCLMFAPEAVDMTFSRQRELVHNIRQEYERGLSGPPSEESFRQFLEGHTDFELLSSLNHMRQGTIEKLRHQAMPAQIKILQQFGEDNPSLKHIVGDPSYVLTKASVGELKKLMKGCNVTAHGCIEKSDLVDRLAEKADAGILRCAWASQKCQAPRCVCGSSLQRVSGLARFRDSLGDQATGVSDEELQRRVQHLQGQGGGVIICDICEKNVPLSDASSVWTCVNRNSTMLHATSYDICDQCFADSVCL